MKDALLGSLVEGANGAPCVFAAERIAFRNRRTPGPSNQRLDC